MYTFSKSFNSKIILITEQIIKYRSFLKCISENTNLKEPIMSTEFIT